MCEECQMRTALKALRPIPRNTLRNVRTGRLGSSSVEMIWRYPSQRVKETLCDVTKTHLYRDIFRFVNHLL